VHESGPDVTAEAIRAQRMKDAAHVGGKRCHEPRRDDVALRCGIAARHERRQEGADQHDQQDGGAECGAPVAKEPAHALALRRGSTHAARMSASMLPATTSAALIAVAAITTG